jgi:hypothetical protein
MTKKKIESPRQDSNLRRIFQKSIILTNELGILIY